MKGNDLVLRIGKPLLLKNSSLKDPKNLAENIREKVKDLL